MLEGWSDYGFWRTLLPWPEETRKLPWKSARYWKDELLRLEREVPIDYDRDPGGPPFLGGWIGLIAYEAAATEEDVAPREEPIEGAMFFARHRAGVVVDPRGRAFLFAPDGEEQAYAARLACAPLEVRPEVRSSMRDSLGGGMYTRCVEQIRTSIRDGDVYQVNLTRAFSSDTPCDPARLYRTLTGARPPRSSAFIRIDRCAIASASPEVLLSFDRVAGIADTRPIKGTVRRKGDEAREIEWLLRSEKDAAEHLMIVDVSRNDMGKIAAAGRVSVAAYREVKTLEYVHHLESTVRATGLAGRSATEVLAALSPAASITGAPKRAAVQMIRDIEPVPRGVYCGSIGFIDGRRLEMSVAIRTAIATDDHVRYHAGGGIVWDSNAKSEDDECRAKAAAFLRFMEGAG